MITHSSLQNPALRANQLRHVLHRLPSLKWRNNATTRYERIFAGEVAIVKILEDAAAYIKCAYCLSSSDPRTLELAHALTAAILDLAKVVKQQSQNGKPISTKAISPVTALTTAFYQQIRGQRVPVGCIDNWTRLGLLEPVAF
jgi:hypothetical protein